MRAPLALSLETEKWSARPFQSAPPPEEEAYRLYTELFVECSLETGKHLSKAEREEHKLTDIKAGPLPRSRHS